MEHSWEAEGRGIKGCIHVHAVLKITGGHRSISDQFAHMTAQLTLEPVIWSDHSFERLYCSIN